MSLYSASGIPIEIGSALFLVALCLTLAPYLAGLEVGPVKIPATSPHQQRVLKLIGPLLVFLAILPFLSFMPLDSPKTITGQWILLDTVDESSNSQYLDSVHRFSLQLEATGNQLTGRAEKQSSDDKNMIDAEKSQITIKGDLKDRLFKATFEENGKIRGTHGKFVWRFSKDYRAFEGSFESTAAKTKGRCFGYKVPE